jgi:hypothetical protein
VVEECSLKEVDVGEKEVEDEECSLEVEKVENDDSCVVLSMLFLRMGLGGGVGLSGLLDEFLVGVVER